MTPKTPHIPTVLASNRRSPRPGSVLIGTAVAAAAVLACAASAGVVDSANGFVLRSNGNISLEGNVQAGGSVGALGSVTQGYGAFVDGVVQMGTSRTWASPVVDPWSAPSGAAVSLGYAESRTLTAGNYGAFNSGSSATLNLDAGNYSFSSFSLGWSGTVNANTAGGDVYMYIAGALNAADASRFQVTGPNRLIIVTGGNASFGYQSNVTAAVYSGGTLNFGGSSQFAGTAFSTGSMSAGYGSTFAYIVPAPGAIALLPIAAGVALGGGGRRRRSAAN